MSGHKPFWILTRCKRCVFYDGDEEVCRRDYERKKIVWDCKIRPYRGAPWRDAFIQRSSLLLDLSHLPVEPMQDKLTREEKEERIKVYLGAYLRAREKHNRKNEENNE